MSRPQGRGNSIFMKTKTCSRCSEDKRLSEFHYKKQIDYYMSFCRSCYSKYRSSYEKSNPKKINAKQKVLYHIKIGNIKRTPCEICGESKTHAHHDDYNKPKLSFSNCVDTHLYHSYLLK